jgi:hypothetical protein
LAIVPAAIAVLLRSASGRLLTAERRQQGRRGAAPAPLGGRGVSSIELAKLMFMPKLESELTAGADDRFDGVIAGSLQAPMRGSGDLRV